MRLTGLSLFFSVLLLAGCGGDDGGTPPVTTNPRDDGGNQDDCEDEDGDGAGYGCEQYDCDDDDPERIDNCLNCNQPNKNCPCDEGTDPLSCTPDNLGEEKEENGQLLQCVEGQRWCRAAVGVEEEVFVWTDCVGVFMPVFE